MLLLMIRCSVFFFTGQISLGCRDKIMETRFNSYNIDLLLMQAQRRDRTPQACSPCGKGDTPCGPMLEGNRTSSSETAAHLYLQRMAHIWVKTALKAGMPISSPTPGLQNSMKVKLVCLTHGQKLQVDFKSHSSGGTAAKPLGLWW
uniref:Uncharacterized protein n=1 Tax=Sphaerodactylus townsendi TaxID=933632 RepID=A0ACB8ENT0_9SAUR